MKNRNILLSSLGFAVLLMMAFTKKQAVAPSLKGSWKVENGMMICSETYFSIAYFNSAQKKFIATLGGTYTITGSEINFKVEFHSADKSLVGESETIPFDLKEAVFTYDGSQGKMVFTKIGEANTSPLAALWQIVGRENKEGKMTDMPKAARKTIKLLTDNRFQWAAINTQTGEFSGTGGGTYTLINGKYTETIEFFSRDSSRVGASLSFDAAIQDKKWDHSGKSSTGNRVHEAWEKQD
jgi:hypothetical protein